MGTNDVRAHAHGDTGEGHWQPLVTRIVGGHRAVIDVKNETRDAMRLGLCICVDCGTTWSEGGEYIPLCCAS